MTEIFFKRDSSEDYDWFLRVIREENFSQTYTIKYIVKDHLFIDQVVQIQASDPDMAKKTDSIKHPLLHLMAGTPVSAICCASFREAVVNLFMSDNYLKN
jgi:hypothetical protein